MTQNAVIVLTSGFLVFAAGVQLGIWHIMAGPDRPNYPTSGKWKRRIMFLLMASLLYRGLELMQSAPVAAPLTDGGLGMFAGAATLCAFFGIMLVDHLRNWLPARTHDRIRQLLHVASCKPSPGLVAARRSAAIPGQKVPPADIVSPSLVELALAGFKVAGPKDGPEALR